MDYAPDADRARETACRCPKKQAHRIKASADKIIFFVCVSLHMTINVFLEESYVCGSFIISDKTFS